MWVSRDPSSQSNVKKKVLNPLRVEELQNGAGESLGLQQHAKERRGRRRRK